MLFYSRCASYCVVLLLLFFGKSFGQQDPARIACIGDNVTYGDGMQTRAHNNYPSQLQAMLGTGHVVENFGFPESDSNVVIQLLNTSSTLYQRVRLFHPTIIFLMLPAGNKDWSGDRVQPESAISQLVSELKRSLPSARIILLAPPPEFIIDSILYADPFTTDRLIPAMQRAAFTHHCELINLYPSFDHREDLFPDSVHMCSLGATLIAKRLYEVVMLKTKSYDIFPKLKVSKKISSFYGYSSADFMFMGRACKVVKPMVAADRLPWVWRARFWGHEPQTDIALLERGYHIVYCDVAELYGNKECIRIWNGFYNLVHGLGLAEKAALEGMSRGGIYMYNWALANPGRVACIYADAPVLDMKSWPGGKYKGPGSKDDWEMFKNDFNLTEAQAIKNNGSPLDKAPEIARLGFPMLHVVGDADEVVPVDENTGPFEAMVRKSGGDITVIHKPGVGHHPHSLVNPEPIVRFILRNTGQKLNFATVAAPGSEYRSGAGWVEGTGWWDNNKNINDLLESSPRPDIIFLGNSITQGIAGQRNNLTYKPGLAIFDSVYKGYSWQCAGISGDRTQHVLWRLQHGSYVKANPSLIVVTIGVNNFSEDTPAEVAAGIDSMLRFIRRSMPTTKVLLIGPLPCGVKPNDMLRQKYNAVHSKILNFSKDAAVEYLPLANVFITKDGTLDLSLCSGDGIHFIEGGYRAWALAMKPVIDRILK